MRDTATIDTKKAFDVSDEIALLDSSRYPLFALLTSAKGKDPVSGKSKKLKKVKATNPKFRWYEDEYGARKADIDSAQGSTDPDATPSVDVGSDEVGYFQTGDVVMVPSEGWRFEVTGISSPNLQLSNELGGATSAADISSAAIWIIGNANEEGAGSRDENSTTVTEKFNYTQIFRTSVSITNTAKQTETRPRSNDLDYQRRKKAEEHAVDIERAFLFGQRSKDTSGDHPKRFTGGVLPRISTNASANVDTESEFESFLEDGFAHGSTEKYMFTSGSFLSTVNGFAKDKLQVDDNGNTYGIRIWKYESPHGTVDFIKHPLLQGTPYGNYGILLDMKTLSYRYLQGRDTMLLSDIGAKADDGREDEYKTECGLQLEQEESSAVVSNDSL